MDTRLNYYTPEERIEKRIWFRDMVIRTGADLRKLYAEREQIRKELEDKKDVD
jgi:hypothetical protein